MTPPIIKDNAVIGGGVTILPNVTVGENSVIGGGSVVAKDVPPRLVSTGVPAKVVMTLEEYEGKRDVFIKARRKVSK